MSYMTATETIDAAFNSESVLIGQMLAGYGELEYRLSELVAGLSKNSSVHLAGVFKLTSRAARLEVFDALIRPKAEEMGLAVKYAHAMEAVEHCQALHAQYDCCHWSARNGRIRFLNMEEQALAPEGKARLKWRDTNLDLLTAQLAYFDYARVSLRFLQQAMNRARGGAVATRKLLPTPPTRDRPPLYLQTSTQADSN
ncbi:MAG: hypothetical protein VX640_10945 [Pseudomonadota bacterium]|nr:hypothetical protein [Pseudomonadota bacterium]